MRTLYLLRACVLLSTTLFSCTADDFETANKGKITNEVKNNSKQTTYETGPDDDPMPTTPPPPKK